MAEQALDRIQRQLSYATEEKKKSAAPAAPAAAPKKKELSDAVKAGIAAGNINISGPSETPGDTHMELVAASKQAMLRDETLLAQFDRRKVARQLALPTDDDKVKQMLREHGHPICLFAEGPADRRERLREVLAALGEEAILRGTSEAPKKEEKKEAEVWYHEGPDALSEVRRWVADYSLPRARDRLKAARIELAHVDEDTKRANTQAVHTRLASFSIFGSQVGDTRPLSSARFSPDSQVLAVGSWSGLCKLWSVPDCRVLQTLRGHTERVGTIEWHPKACGDHGPADLNLASCSADGSVHLWSTAQETPIGSLENCGTRVARVGFHPSGRLLGGTCYDMSWRLWDLTKGVETMAVDGAAEKMEVDGAARREDNNRMYSGTEILYQEGHSRPVYGMAFHPDGSLVGTTSHDCTARVWDLRSGKNILVLQGHVKEVLGISFAPDGFHLATSAEDHTVRMWDLRARGCFYTLPAHTNLVSDVQYSRTSSDFFVTSSYDNTARIWSSPGCTPLATLTGHEGKVMSVDVAPDLSYIATASYDRTFKFWAPEKIA